MAKAIYHGELPGSTDAIKMPAKKFQNGYVKAMIGNSGNVYIGSSSDVTIANGSTDADTTTGYVLDAGEVLELKTPGNLDDYWYICDNAGDEVIYFLEDW